jgi:putative transposase
MAAVKRNISLLDILHQIGMDEDTDFLREGAQLLTQRLIELEATKVIGADKYERTPERCNSRNGYRNRHSGNPVSRIRCWTRPYL